jgi:ATP-binding cassette subfamily B protein
VAAGERVALVGPSGGGKSTLAGLVLRLHDPGAGRVEADGIDLRDMTLASLRAQVALVPQEPLIVSGTVRENLTLGLAQEVSDAEIVDAARAAAAHDFISAMPGGYDAEVAERGGSLSAGQRQRLSLARALLRRTPILVLDEPTTGLDGPSEAIVAEAIEAVSKDRTTLLITHDLALAAACDRVVVLDDGRIVEAGRPGHLLQAGGWFAAAHARQRGEGPHALAS